MKEEGGGVRPSCFLLLNDEDSSKEKKTRMGKEKEDCPKSSTLTFPVSQRGGDGGKNMEVLPLFLMGDDGVEGRKKRKTKKRGTKNNGGYVSDWIATPYLYVRASVHPRLPGKGTIEKRKEGGKKTRSRHSALVDV